MAYGKKNKNGRIPLETVYKPRQDSGVPLCILDFRVAVHGILATVSEFASLLGIEPPPKTDGDWAPMTEWYKQIVAQTVWPDFARASWALKLMRGPDMLPRAEYRVIVVDDSKMQVQHTDAETGGTYDKACYWRTVVETEYKGTRGTTKDSCYGSIVAIGHAIVEELGLPMYSEPLYEADDWAGVIHRMKLNAEPGSVLANRELYYSTVDSDWLQLVDDATRQLWANTGPWPSRLKNEAETRAYVLKRMGKSISHPREIAKVKQDTGDSADNLAIGSHISLFDLINPHPEYDLEKLPSAAGLLADLCSPAPNTRSEVLRKSAAWLNSKGLPICIRA